MSYLSDPLMDRSNGLMKGRAAKKLLGGCQYKAQVCNNRNTHSFCQPCLQPNQD